MKVKEGFLLKSISFFVVLSHLLMITFIGFYEGKPPTKKINQKMSVQTINLNPATLIAQATVPKEEVKKEEVKKEEVKKEEVKKEEVKKEEVKKYERAKITETPKPPERRVNKPGPIKQEPIEQHPLQQHPLKQEPLKPKPIKEEPLKKNEDKKKVVEKPKPSAIASNDRAKKQAEEIKAKKKELLAQAEKNLASLAKMHKSPALKEPVLQKVGKLNVDSMSATDELSALNVRELGYRDELVSRLKSLLILPERGDVKIKLTLDHLGKVIKLVIVNFESEKNKKYIEKSIKALVFPSFQGNFNGAQDYTFSITLK